MDKKRYAYSEDIESIIDMKTQAPDGGGREVTTPEVVELLNQLEAELAQRRTQIANLQPIYLEVCEENQRLRDGITDAIGKINNETDPDAPVPWLIENVRGGLYDALKESGQ